MTDRKTIRAIETQYAGHRFRSRLEARWAVFFNAMDIPWQYEVQGYSAAGFNYLPDFWLPDTLGGCHAEVRPPGTADHNERRRLTTIVSAGLPGGLLLLGAIPPAGNGFRFNNLVRYHDSGSDFFDSRHYGDDPFIFAHDALLGGGGWEFFGQSGVQGDVEEGGPSVWLWPDGSGSEGWEGWNSTPALNAALIKAKTARFEHGETPR